MNIVIIEDEAIAARRIRKMVTELEESANVVAVLDTVEASVQWLQKEPLPDLILMDIELVDGQSFEIFGQVDVTCPVIFTTAYDEFAIKAFKVNSVDYLLKPIQEKDLQQSLLKFRSLKKTYGGEASTSRQVEALLREMTAGHKNPATAFRDRILVKQGQRMFSLTTDEVAYFFTKEKLNYVCTKNNRQFLIDFTLDELEKSLNPQHFFRANRQFIVEYRSVDKASLYFNSKLKVVLRPESEEEVIISRDKAAEFRHWLGE
jgi:two-component system LytT family response regulator